MTKTPWYEKYKTVEELEAHVSQCVCNGNGYFRVNVLPNHRFFGKAIQCMCKRKQIISERARHFRLASGMTDAQLERWRLGLWQPTKIKVPQGKDREATVAQARKLLSLCKRYAKNPKGWLILSGPYGTGKSHLGFGIASELVLSERSAYAATMPNMLDMLRNSYQTDSYQVTLMRLRDTPLIVLDDIGVERPSGWVAEVTYSIMDYRYTENLPTVLTTNQRVSGDQPPGSGIDGRLWSRMQEHVIVNLPWGDYRTRDR